MFEKLFKPALDEAQEIVSKKFEEESATDEVLDLQVKINSIRHILDITDDKEKIYEDFVQ